MTSPQVLLIRPEYLNICNHNSDESVVLNQLIYWTSKGYTKIYKTLKDLCNDCLNIFSPSSASRYVSNLIKNGFINADNRNKNAHDRTLTYTINALTIAEQVKNAGFELPKDLEKCLKKSGGSEMENGNSTVENVLLKNTDKNTNSVDVAPTPQRPKPIAEKKEPVVVCSSPKEPTKKPQPIFNHPLLDQLKPNQKQSCSAIVKQILKETGEATAKWYITYATSQNPRNLGAYIRKCYNENAFENHLANQEIIAREKQALSDKQRHNQELEATARKLNLPNLKKPLQTDHEQKQALLATIKNNGKIHLLDAWIKASEKFNDIMKSLFRKGKQDFVRTHFVLDFVAENPL